jgi:hypothetical protein
MTVILFLVAGVLPRLGQAQSVSQHGMAAAVKPYEYVEPTIPDPMDDLGSLEPKDGKWLKDEDGREYFLKKLAKKPGEYQWITENRIKYKRWYSFDVAKHDDEFLYLKIYKPAVTPPGLTPEAIAAREAAEEKAIESTYQTEVGTSDRIRLISFDEGLPKTGMWRNGLAVADVDGDGELDIVHGPPRKGALVPRIFLGDGKGHWKFWREAVFPRAPYDYGDAAAADFNGDGRTDLALAFHLRGILVLIQDKDKPGSFIPWTEGMDMQIPGSGSDASGFSSREIEVVDWNSDGRPDILALGEGPRPAGNLRGTTTGLISSFAHGGVVYLNHGDGTWKRLDKGLQHNGIFGDALAIGDFDGNGRTDFLTGSNVLNRRDILNLGNKDDDTWESVELDLFRPAAYMQSVAAADFNGDGRDDMAVGFASWEKKLWRTGIDVLLSTETEGWTRRTLSVHESRESFWAMGAGDLDGDGNSDIVATTSEGHVKVFLGDGRGGFEDESTPEIAIPAGCRGYSVRLVDLDRDGRDELVASFAGEGAALPMPGFTESCVTGGEIAVWRSEPNPKESQSLALDTAQSADL